MTTVTAPSLPPPRRWRAPAGPPGPAEAANTITHWSDFDTGGHFAAMEAPDLFVGDVREFFRTVR